jgi:electron transfer flavoprotein alpha subunit
MAGILIYSDKTILALELLTAAKLIAKNNGLNIKAVSINNDEMAEELAHKGVETLKINNSEVSLADTAAVASALQQAAEQLDADTVLLSSNRRGKELAGRLAQVFNAGCLTDVKSLRIDNAKIECIRNVLGGATVATQLIIGDKRVIAISPQAYPAAVDEVGGSINEYEVDVKPSGIRLIKTREKAGDSVDIEAAEVLVVVGQGVESKEDLPIINDIAKTLGGEVACSKPVATDKKWLGEERIVGLSGKICKPELAIILGVSGQVQFNVGIRDAKIIVSINNDEKAFMNQMADYVLIADLKEVLPKLKKAIG